MQPEAETGMNRVLDTLQIPRGVVRRNEPRDGRMPESRINAFASSMRTANPLPVASMGCNGNGDHGVFPQSQGASRVSTAHAVTRPDPRSPNTPGSGQGSPSHSPSLDFLPNAGCLNSIYDDAEGLRNLSAEVGSVMSIEDQLSLAQPTAQYFGPRVERGQSEGEISFDSGDEAEKEVIEQLSSRLGTLKLAGDGHLRFYGPTSNLNLIDVSATEQRPRPDARTVRHNGQDILNHLRVGQLVDQALEDHLIKLYFAWQNPSSYVVDREMFMTARSRWRIDKDDTPFFSEVLANAMSATLPHSAALVS
jgi:hypothetical protein